jgi:hypothetical protein
MIIAIVLFALSAVFGATMAIMRLRGRLLPPMGLALVHGPLAAAGLVFLLVAVLSGGAADLIRIALIVFIAAALGGFFLFSFHLRGKALPVPLVLVHGLVAVGGFVILLIGTFS